MMQLQRKIKVEKFFGGANHKMTAEEREQSMSLGGLRGLSNENFSSAKIGNKAPSSSPVLRARGDGTPGPGARQPRRPGQGTRSNI
jgi:hypothetical protein